MLKGKKILTFRPSKSNPRLLHKLEALAKKDNRKLNNYIEIILLRHLEEIESKKESK